MFYHVEHCKCMYTYKIKQTINIPNIYPSKSIVNYFQVYYRIAGKFHMAQIKTTRISEGVTGESVKVHTRTIYHTFDMTL